MERRLAGPKFFLSFKIVHFFLFDFFLPTKGYCLGFLVLSARR